MLWPRPRARGRDGCWVWSNGDDVVFDNIECPALSLETGNERSARLILDIYSQVAKAIKSKGASEVVVGSKTHGMNQGYFDQEGLEVIDIFDQSRNYLIESIFPDDASSFIPFPEDDDGKQDLYTDSHNERRKLARILEKMVRLSSKLDRVASDIADEIDSKILDEILEPFIKKSNYGGMITQCQQIGCHLLEDLGGEWRWPEGLGERRKLVGIPYRVSHGICEYCLPGVMEEMEKHFK